MQRNPVSIANMNHLSMCSSCFTEKAKRGPNHVHDRMVYVCLHPEPVMGVCSSSLGHISV